MDVQGRGKNLTGGRSRQRTGATVLNAQLLRLPAFLPGIQTGSTGPGRHAARRVSAAAGHLPALAAVAVAVAGVLNGLHRGRRAHLGPGFSPPPCLLLCNLLLLIHLLKGSRGVVAACQSRTNLLVPTPAKGQAAEHRFPGKQQSSTAMTPHPCPTGAAHLAVGHHGAGRRQHKHVLPAVVVLGIGVLLGARRLRCGYERGELEGGVGGPWGTQACLHSTWPLRRSRSWRTYQLPPLEVK